MKLIIKLIMSFSLTAAIPLLAIRTFSITFFPPHFETNSWTDANSVEPLGPSLRLVYIFYSIIILNKNFELSSYLMSELYGRENGLKLYNKTFDPSVTAKTVLSSISCNFSEKRSLGLLSRALNSVFLALLFLSFGFLFEMKREVSGFWGGEKFVCEISGIEIACEIGLIDEKSNCFLFQFKHVWLDIYDNTNSNNETKRLFRSKEGKKFSNDFWYFHNTKMYSILQNFKIIFELFPSIFDLRGRRYFPTFPIRITFFQNNSLAISKNFD